MLNAHVLLHFGQVCDTAQISLKQINKQVFCCVIAPVSPPPRVLISTLPACSYRLHSTPLIQTHYLCFHLTELTIPAKLNKKCKVSGENKLALPTFFWYSDHSERIHCCLSDIAFFPFSHRLPAFAPTPFWISPSWF